MNDPHAPAAAQPLHVHAWSTRPRMPKHVPPRVLLAEDDSEMRTLVAMALRSQGYAVTEIADGGRLLVHLTNTYGKGDAYDAYDLMVSDIRMPVCSGLHILEALRRAQWHTPVILMTAFGDARTRRDAESLGAILFDKPFDIDDLVAVARTIVAPEIA